MSNRTFQGNYVTSGRFQRDCDKEQALEARRFARALLRWEMPNAHKEWMRRAIRYWRYYADAVRKERKAA